MRLGMPLHRGPHRRYNALVIERIGQIEAGWSRFSRSDAQGAAVQVHWRLSLLQRALRRFLLDSGRRHFVLNRRDPLGQGIDFSDLDAMADALWNATAILDQGIPVQAIPVQAMPVQPMPARARSSSFAA